MLEFIDCAMILTEFAKYAVLHLYRTIHCLLTLQIC